jgi:delta-aminolevulinic acid dehydratase/porphobilinogen synthase
MPTQTQTRLDLVRRGRRLRRSPSIRALVRETRLSPDMFIYPLFVCEGSGVRRQVGSMPGVYQLSVDEAVKEAVAARAEGVSGVLLFGLPAYKDEVGSAAYDAQAPVQARGWKERSHRCPSPGEKVTGVRRWSSRVKPVAGRPTSAVSGSSMPVDGASTG